MKHSRRLTIMAAALGAAMAASIASSGAALTAGGSGRLQRPLAPAALQLAQADRQATSAVTEEQRAKIKSAIENIAPGSVKQAAVDIANAVVQLLDAFDMKGTPQQQKDRLAAEIHRVFRVWRKQHAEKADRDDLQALLIKLASIGVPVDEVILPAVQRAQASAAARSNASRPTVLSEEQKAEIESTLATLTPEEVKQAAADLITVVVQIVDAVATGETVYGTPTGETKQQKEALAAAVHRAVKVWEKDHAGKVDSRDLEALLIKLAAIGVPVDTVIVPAVQQEVAAIKSGAPPATLVSDEQRARIKTAVQKLARGDLTQAAEAIVIGIDRAIQIEASTATTPQEKMQLELRLHRTFKEWTTIHARTDRDGLVELLIKLAAVGVPVDTVIIPSVQQEQIRSEVQKLSPEDVKTAAEDIIIVVDRTFTIKLSSASTPQQKAQLEAQVRRTIDYWQAKHAEKADRDDLALLLIELASIGVPVDDVIIPAVQHAQNVAAARSTSPPAAASDHPAEPVIIEHHR